MQISLSADRSVWLELPTFAEGESSEEASRWEDGVVEEMRSAWRGELDPASEVLVREALRNGIRKVSDSDSVTLQYWPSASIANAVVHLTAAAFAEGEPRQRIPLADIPYATQPVVTTFQTELLGVGVEARYLTPLEAGSSVVLGGVNFLFENDFGYIAVGVEPTLPRLVGLMLEPLREVVRSVRVADDAEGAWMRCSGPGVDLPARGEEWTFDSVDSADALVEAPR